MARYIVADLHGRFDLYQEIEKFRKTGDYIICLGDCGDRGPQSLETIKAVADNPNWYYMLGNHEHLTGYALNQMLTDNAGPYVDAVGDCLNNGGYDALFAMYEDNPRKWVQFFRSLPYKQEIKSDSGMTLLLSHSGYDPTTAAGVWDYIWNREHFLLDYPTGPQFENTLMIHGHTPNGLLAQHWKPSDGAVWYGNTGQKIDIDMGAVWTGVTLLLDVDTIEEHILYAESEAE